MSSPQKSPSKTSSTLQSQSNLDTEQQRPTRSRRHVLRAHKVHVRASHRHVGRYSHRDHHTRHLALPQETPLHSDDEEHDPAGIDAEVGIAECTIEDGESSSQSTPIDFVTLDDTESNTTELATRDTSRDALLFSALEMHLFSHPLFPSTRTTASSLSESSNVDSGFEDSHHDSEHMPVLRYVDLGEDLSAESLTPELLQSRCFHLICSASRCRRLVADIVSRRKSADPPVAYTRPIFIWEPLSSSCRPGELLNCTNTLPVVDVCSLPHARLADFMGQDSLDQDTGLVSAMAVERYCEQLLSSMPLSSYTLVIHADDQGYYLARNPGTRRPSKRSTKFTGQPKKPPRSGGLSLDMDMESLFAGLLQDPDGTIPRDDAEIDSGLDLWIASEAVIDHNATATVPQP